MSRGVLASRTSIRAFREGPYVLLVAEGELPTPGFNVDIVPSPLRIFPPQFELRRFAKPGIFPQHVTPYRYLEVVRFPVDQPVITVEHADGADRVDIEPVGPELAVYAAAVRSTTDESGSPTGTPAGGAAAAAPDAADTADEAVGLSPRLSFDDAFAKALANLPPAEATHPDTLTRVEVKEISGLFGGIAGFHHLLVRVSRTTS
ncbi:conserved hypothetical protein [Frankia sp. AiPs1]|uniref:hypothetical protein n=1 Tax=Frankia sp. AiPa1 TaxID=573492 RepID=UPI00202B6815|nr:hypothetical protein [Frankia sp. AiPa1]MCL9760358.1 hypothetical protein [Frankia sp. AiPa1]